MTIISLTTDFGNQDGFVGTMKGVIWGIAPQAQIADISHEIPPQDIRSGAIALWRAAPYFPPGSVHIAVIDPGVGTDRVLASTWDGTTWTTPTPLAANVPHFSLPRVAVARDGART